MGWCCAARDHWVGWHRHLGGVNEDAPPGPARATPRHRTDRPRFDPSLYDPTFVPPSPVAGRGALDPPAEPAPGGPNTDGATQERNAPATVSLVLGMCSLFIPLLAIPGVIVGLASLRRIGRFPSLPGRERALAGIITSVVLGSLSLVVLIVIAIGGG